MDYCKHNHKSNKSRRETVYYPSFSSSLLDHIYRSIDDHHLVADDDQVMTTTTNTKHYINNTHETIDAANFQRIQNWMERKTSNAAKSDCAAPAGFHPRKVGGDFMSWSSSDSSSAGLFSSEADSNCGVSSKSSSSTYRPKPIKTINNHERTEDKMYKSGTQNQESSGVVKRSKLKALKMYGDSLKKVKQQPISPGAKLASFLNSIFTNAKKGKSNSSNTSPACSTSRSCLSKTGKLSNNGAKRSVRFDPVSEIVDGDRHKYLKQQQHSASYKNEESKLHKKKGSDNQSVEEAAREVLRNYQRKVESQLQMMEEDYEDDNDSCGSSDLFELDSLNNNMMGKYMEELPVYETTYVDTNRAIAHGLLV